MRDWMSMNMDKQWINSGHVVCMMHVHMCVTDTAHGRGCGHGCGRECKGQHGQTSGHASANTDEGSDSRRMCASCVHMCASCVSEPLVCCMSMRAGRTATRRERKVDGRKSGVGGANGYGAPGRLERKDYIRDCVQNSKAKGT